MKEENVGTLVPFLLFASNTPEQLVIYFLCFSLRTVWIFFLREWGCNKTRRGYAYREMEKGTDDEEVLIVICNFQRNLLQKKKIEEYVFLFSF